MSSLHRPSVGRSRPGMRYHENHHLDLSNRPLTRVMALSFSSPCNSRLGSLGFVLYSKPISKGNKELKSKFTSSVANLIFYKHSCKHIIIFSEMISIPFKIWLRRKYALLIYTQDQTQKRTQRLMTKPYCV